MVVADENVPIRTPHLHSDDQDSYRYAVKYGYGLSHCVYSTAENYLQMNQQNLFHIKRANNNFFFSARWHIIWPCMP